MNQPFPLLLLLIYSFLFPQITKAQSPAIEWQHLYGGPGGDYSSDIEPTNDGGFIVAGYTEGNGGDIVGYHGNSNIGDLWVIKTDSKQNIQWKKCLGGTSMEYSIMGSSIKQTPDGGYVIAGTSASVDCDITGNHGGVDFWVVKLDSKGNILWNKCYGGSKNDYAYSIAIAPDGGYVIAGEVESADGDVTGNRGDRDGWVIKISDTGMLLWQKSFGGSNADEFYDVAVNKQGDCILGGYTRSNDGDINSNHGLWDYWIIKLNNSGDLLWNKTYGGTEPDLAWSLKATADGGCIVAGQTGSNNGDVSGKHLPLVPSADYWLLKLSNTGAIDWQKCYGGDNNEIAFAVQLTNDGGYIIAGSAESPDGDVDCNSGLTDCYVVKVNSKGDIQWHKVFGGSYYDEAHSVQPLSDGGYLVAGYSCSSEINGYHPVSIENATCADFWVVKLSSSGLPAPSPSVQIDKTSATICAGRATLKASAKYAGTKYTYQWLRNGADVNIHSSVYTASDFKDGEVVVCILTTGGQCEDVGATEARDTIILKTNPAVILPQVSIAANSTSVCNCTPVTFTASVKNGGTSPQYQWMVNNISTGNTESVFASATLQQGDAVKCVYSDKNACIINGPVTSDSITILSGEAVAPTVSVTSSLNDICKGTKVIFKAKAVNAGPHPSFQWKVNGVNAGNNIDSFASAAFNNNDVISCTVTADPLFTCVITTTAISNDVTIHIVDKSTPSVNINAASTTVCKESPVTFTAVTSDAGQNPSFQWKVNGSNTGSSGNTFITSALNDGDTVSCSVKTDTLFSCTTTPVAVSNNIVMTVTTGISPSVNINASDNDVCFGTEITFNASVMNESTSPHYQWKLNGEDVGSDKEVYNSNTLKNGDSLLCTIIAGGACSIAGVSSNVVHMRINELPAVTVNPADTFITAGSSVRLNTNITGTVTSFTWEPADKLSDPLAVSPVTVPLSDDQTYKLTVEGDKGCNAEKIVVIKMVYGINMPSAFTPNRDGLNDLFRIKYPFPIKQFQMRIYNRWGQLIFESNNITKGWNGTFNGIDASMNTYVWFISLTDNEGKQQRAHGTVTLIR